MPISNKYSDVRLKNYIKLKWQFTLISYKKNQLKLHEMIKIPQPVTMNKAHRHKTERACLINSIFDETVHC